MGVASIVSRARELVTGGLTMDEALNQAAAELLAPPSATGLARRILSALVTPTPKRPALRIVRDTDDR